MNAIRGWIYLLVASYQAAVYAQDPNCNTSWTKTSSTWTCIDDGTITFDANSSFVPSATLTLVANNGFYLSNNQLGSATKQLHLRSDYGAINGSDSILYGNIKATSGRITLSDSEINGTLDTSGDVDLTNGRVTGKVTSSSNKVITSGTELGGGVTAHSGMTISGGSVSGALVLTAANEMNLFDLVMTAGSVSGASSVYISNSQLGSAASVVSVSALTNDIYVLNNSVVFGNLTAAGSYGTVYVQGGSAVYGSCGPHVNPVDGCSASPPPSVDHYELSYSSPGVTCEAEPITIRACSNSDCSSVYSGSSTVTVTANNGGSISTPTVTFSGGTGTSYLRLTSPGSSTVGITNASPQATNPLECKNAGAVSNCSVTFADTGLKFAATDAVAAIPAQWAGENYTATLRAIKTSSQTGACEARVSGSSSVNLGFRCVNPSSCVAGQKVTVQNTAVTGSNASGAVSYTPVTLTFDNTGKALVPFNYSDVGEISLQASLAIAASGTEPAVTLQSASNSVVVRPYALNLVSVSAGTVSNPATTSETTGFTSAGTALTVDVTATNAAGAITPNFGNETTPPSLSLNLSSIVYPLSVAPKPADLIDNGSFVAVSGSPGRRRNTAISYRNVGSIKLTAQLQNNSYLAAGDVKSKPTSAVIGRFYPANFKLVTANHTAQCNGFTYMAQPQMALSYQVQAHNVQGGVVSNYGAGYAGPATFTLVAKDGTTGGNLASRVTGAPTPYWTAGELIFSTTTMAFSRAASPDGPFNQLQLGLKRNTEQDSRDFLTADKNFNAATNGSCSASNSCDAITLGNPVAYRYGRLRLEQAAGDETSNVPVVLKAEYFDGSAFAGHNSDNCSAVTVSALTATGTPTVTVSGSNGQLSAGKNAVNSLLLSAPNQAGSWQLKYTAPSYLKYNWDPTVAGDEDPSAEALFGRYRGNDRLIFQREQ